ncbi:hypothetical protein BS78_06G271900 [Paspalum vaginatum]|nr:hypothetical protein BS78_06G271900 [Paspalum vaginatum]
MPHTFVPYEDARGCWHQECPENCPLAMTLHHRLQELGYLSCPRYIVRHADLGLMGETRVRVRMPQNPRVSEEGVWEVQGSGLTSGEAFSDAAYRALTELCTRHLGELEGSEVMFLPPNDRAQPEWERRLRNLNRSARDLRRRQMREQVHYTSQLADLYDQRHQTYASIREGFLGLRAQNEHMLEQQHRDTSEIISLGLRQYEDQRTMRDLRDQLHTANLTIQDQTTHLELDHTIIDNLNEQVIALQLQNDQLQAELEESSSEEEPMELVPEGSGATQGSSGIASGSVGPPAAAPGTGYDSDAGENSVGQSGV